MRDELHAENVLGVQFGVFAGLGHLDAAALAAAAGVNLRLDDHAAVAPSANSLRATAVGFFERVGHFALGHGHAVFRQDFFRLILVNFHLGMGPTRPAAVGVARSEYGRGTEIQRQLKYYLARRRPRKRHGRHIWAFSIRCSYHIER